MARPKRVARPAHSAEQRQALDALWAASHDCMPADRPRLHGALKRLRAIPDPARFDKEVARLRVRIDAALGRLAKRRASVPEPSYPEGLPVVEARAALLEAIQANPVTIVAGATGSGKTTQLPKLCLEAGRGAQGMIGVTQPRRIAALSVAERVAEEIGQPVGQAVGYQIRFGKALGPTTLVKFMTDGILLTETQSDRLLLAYDTLILDEVHERNLNVDFLLGYVQRILPKRPDLRLIVSSATLAVERYRDFFAGAPVIEVEGRTYPVEVRYRPPPEEDPDLESLAADAVEEILTESDTGDILLFLPTERSIRDAHDTLSGRGLGGVEIVPLFGRLGTDEQRRVFRPGTQRRVVLSTNVAETSVTVPRIRYVVDGGLARIRRFQTRSQIERLQIESISQASAAQRTGRCGRLGPGICLRLYSEADFRDRPAYTDPEIRRASLAGVILQMESLRLGHVEDFPFLDPPSATAIRRGYDELRELGAVAETPGATEGVGESAGRVAGGGARGLSDMGRRMAALPLEPRYARILLAGADEGALAETLILVAALSIQDPRERPLEKQQAADDIHHRWADERSDFVAWLNLWGYIQRELPPKASGSRMRRFCKQHFLNFRRLREWLATRDQLAELMAAQGHRPRKDPATYEEIHRALLAGLLSRIGKRTEQKDYQGGTGARFVLWPGSGLAKKGPEWVLAAELIETSRLFGRCVAQLEPRWIEEVAGDRAKRSYSDPHWDEKTEHVRAYEQVTVMGLPVVERRRVHYGRVAPEASRALFIREALVGGKLRRPPHAIQANRELVAGIEEIQHRERRQDLLVAPESLAAFYEARLPARMSSAKELERFCRRDGERLRMAKDDILLETPGGLRADRFPPTIRLVSATHATPTRAPAPRVAAAESRALRDPQGAPGSDSPTPPPPGCFAVAYRFEPGHPADGVTARVPLEALPQIEAWRMEWLVPGLLGEKAALLIRSLPRRLRKLFVPIPETVEAILPDLAPPPSKGHGTDRSAGPSEPVEPLLPLLARVLRKRSGVSITVEDFRPEEVPEHLRINIAVVNRQGRVLDQGRDLEALRAGFSELAKARFDQVDKRRWERAGLTGWEMDALPEAVDLGGCQGYPALAIEGETVAVRLFETPARARSSHADGLVRLAALAMEPQLRNVAKGLPLSMESGMLYATLGGALAQLRTEIVARALRSVFLAAGPDVRDGATFEARLTDCRKGTFKAAHDLAVAIDEALRDALALERAWNQGVKPVARPAVVAMGKQVKSLLGPGFLRRTPLAWALELPRYLRAVRERWDRLEQDPQRDAKRQAEIEPYDDRWRGHWRQLPKGALPSKAWIRYRFLVEEYRVSLFAQGLGTKQKVSPKRLDEAWAEVPTPTNRDAPHQ